MNATLDQLIHENAHSTASFAWQTALKYRIRGDNLYIEILNKRLKYNFEYRGLSPMNALLSRGFRTSLGDALLSYANHELPNLSGSGIGYLTEYIATVTGNLLINFDLSPETDHEDVKKLLRTSISQGYLVRFRVLGQVSPSVMGMITGTLNQVHIIKKYPHSPGVVQVADHEVPVHSSAGFFLSGTEQATPRTPGCAVKATPPSLSRICQPLKVNRPMTSEIIGAVMIQLNMDNDSLQRAVCDLVAHFEEHHAGGLSIYEPQLKEMLTQIMQAFHREEGEVDQTEYIIQALL